MRLTKMPETDYYDISIGEITALVHMEDVFAAIARAYDFGIAASQATVCTPPARKRNRNPTAKQAAPKMERLFQ